MMTLKTFAAYALMFAIGSGAFGLGWIAMSGSGLLIDIEAPSPVLVLRPTVRPASMRAAAHPEAPKADTSRY